MFLGWAFFPPSPPRILLLSFIICPLSTQALPCHAWQSGLLPAPIFHQHSLAKTQSIFSYVQSIKYKGLYTSSIISHSYRLHYNCFNYWHKRPLTTGFFMRLYICVPLEQNKQINHISWLCFPLIFIVLCMLNELLNNMGNVSARVTVYLAIKPVRPFWMW